MTYLLSLADRINQTHCGLGDFTAMCVLATKARKLLLAISPSGCGKSTSMDFVGKHLPNALIPDRISAAGLEPLAEKLTGFKSAIIVDDIATTQSEYARKTTVTTLAALCYTHHVYSAMQGSEYEITNFQGSALVGIQPILLKSLMLLPEWDASIQDKSLRYYHLRRPISPRKGIPQVHIDWGMDLDDVVQPELDNSNNELWQSLITLGGSQWSIARTSEHMSDLLKASAALDKRDTVMDCDYETIQHLCAPMAFENIAVKKDDFEGDRFLDNNLCAVLTEYYTYQGEVALGQLAIDYHLSVSQAYKIMETQTENWQQVSKSPTIYTPSKTLLASLKRYGLEYKKTEGEE